MVPKLAVAAAILLAGCASAPTGSTARSADWPPAVIDAHVQTNFTGKALAEAGVPDSRVELAAEMKRYRVVGAVSMDDPGDPYVDLSDLNVVRCVGLPEKVDAGPLETDLASRRYRCIRIDLGYQRRAASDPDYEPVYRLAEKYGVPVVLQTGTLEYPYTGTFGADEVARRHPKVTFVLAHEGNPRTADERDREDYLRRKERPAVVIGLGDDPWIRPAAVVVYENPNVVLDASAFLVGDLMEASPDQLWNYLQGRVRWTFDYVANPGKIMFGTGWPRTEIGPYLELFKRAIPRKYWQAVFHDNAARVYNFAKRPLPESQGIINVQAVNDLR